MKDNSAKRASFRSSFGLLVALAGSAVGLGNLWRFPYLMGTNGGAAFIIIYLICIVFICLPMMISEFMIGHASKSDAVGAFRVLAPGQKGWRVAGAIAVLCSLFIMCFYSVVGGWTLDYLFKSLGMAFSDVSEGQCAGIFTSMVVSRWEPVIFMTVFLAVSGLIIWAGVEKGIERYSKILMPLLFVIIVIIAVYSCLLPGASAGLSFMFSPDFSKVNGGTILAALGQAFFSLSLGAGMVLTYGSYVKEGENIPKMSLLTAISDTCFALLAGMAIMPAVFAFGLSPSEGPGLVFIVLPEIFSKMVSGDIIAIAFFFVLFVAALTSIISMLEVVVACIAEEFRMKRGAAVLLTLAFVMVFGILCSLSQGVLSDCLIFGKNIFDLFDYTTSNIMMTFGGLVVVIFVGWKMKKPDVFAEYSAGGKFVHPVLYKVLYFLTKYVAPVAIAVIMVCGLIK